MDFEWKNSNPIDFAQFRRSSDNVVTIREARRQDIYQAKSGASIAKLTRFLTENLTIGFLKPCKLFVEVQV